MMIYCLRCKEKTESKDEKKMDAGQKMRVSAVCAKCGGKKSLFMSKGGANMPNKKGSSFLLP